ncbi:MAG: hypothetical protein ACRCS6_09240 [Turicibacter sp.]
MLLILTTQLIAILTLIIAIIYNSILFIKTSRTFKNLPSNGKKRIKTYANRLRYSFIILLVLIFYISIYSRPLSFHEILTIHNQSDITHATLGGNLAINEMQLSQPQLVEIMDLLNSYTYKKTIKEQSYNGFVTFLYVADQNDSNSTYIQIWESGYIIILGSQVYKINTPNKTELYEKISFIIN